TRVKASLSPSATRAMSAARSGVPGGAGVPARPGPRLIGQVCPTAGPGDGREDRPPPGGPSGALDERGVERVDGAGEGLDVHRQALGDGVGGQLTGGDLLEEGTGLPAVGVEL